MKNSGLLKWTNNKNNKTIYNNNTNNRSLNSTNKTNDKNWIHPPEALQKGHIAYLVKYLGSTEVDQPKGIEVVKEGIRKLKFNQHLKKAEGSKTPKVELTVSIDGVAIHEPKTKRNLHQYPLHRISYCADDKAEKRFFSFIAKEADSDKHTCFVFVSDKLAEEITLTIGQAFDLAYRRFIETSAKEVELRKQILTLQKRTEVLESENETLKNRITQISALKDKSDLDEYVRENNIADVFSINSESSTAKPVSSDVTYASINSVALPPPVPPRNTGKSTSDIVNITDDILSHPSISTESDDDDFNPRATNDEEDDFNPRALENIQTSQLTSSSLITTPTSSVPVNGTNNINGVVDASADDFDPRAEEKKPPSYSTTTIVTPAETNGLKSPPSLIPAPPRPFRAQDNSSKMSSVNGSTDLGFDSHNTDPFSPAPTESLPISNSNTDILAQFNEMKAGFSRGLSFGTTDEDFTLESLDPLKN